jgi:hypothetical protein
VKQLGLEILKALLGPLTLGDVPDEAREEPALADPNFTDRQLKRERGAIAPLADYDATDSNDALFSSVAVTSEISIVLLAIRRRHKHFNVLPDDLILGIAKESHRCGAE